MADEFLKKARDEWARSDYEAADVLMKKAAHWADQATSIAQASEADKAEDGLQDADLLDEEPAGEPTTTTQEGVWQ
jgi:hypothetical protein